MWSKLKVLCLHSLTVGCGYCLALVGVTMQGIDTVADALGDPNLKDQISASIGDAKTAGRVLLGISIVTIVARLRSIRKGN